MYDAVMKIILVMCLACNFVCFCGLSHGAAELSNLIGHKVLALLLPDVSLLIELRLLQRYASPDDAYLFRISMLD